VDYSNVKWEMVELGEVCKTTSGGTPLKSKEDEYYKNGKIPWLRSGEVSQGEIYESKLFITEKALKESSAKIFPQDTVLVAMYGATVGQVGLLKFEASTNQAICGVFPNEKFIPEFLFLILKSQKEKMMNLAGGGAQPNISQGIIKNLKIPLPPLEIQEKIVAEINGYQKIIDGAKQVVENWKPSIKIESDWDMVELGEVCDVKAGGTPSRTEKEYWGGDIYWYSSGELNNIYTILPKEKITKKGLDNSNASIFPKGSLLVGMYDTAAFKMSILETEGAFNQAICGIKPSTKISLYFLYLYFSAKKEEYLAQRVGVRQRNLNKGFISKIKIPLPSLEIQEKIVAEIEAEQKMVEASKKLIEIYEGRIKEKIGEVWGERN